MPTRNRGAFAAIVSIVAGALLHAVPAQQWEKASGPANPGTGRFDLEPTLTALRRTIPDRPGADRPIGASAWTVMALLANGSTMRSGPYRDPIKLQVNWLKNVQDEAGRYSPGGLPCPRGDQLMAALAMTETYVASNYTLLKPGSVRGITAADAAMLGPTAPPATVDEFVFSTLLARSATQAKIDAEAVANSGKALTRARSAMVAGKVRRTDAALHLDDLLQGTPHPPELTVARTWPANLTADPLHTLVGALALTVSGMEAKARAAQWQTLDSLVTARETEGEHAGTWSPAGGFDRTTTTAMHAITLALGNGTAGLPLVK